MLRHSLWIVAIALFACSGGGADSLPRGEFEPRPLPDLVRPEDPGYGSVTDESFGTNGIATVQFGGDAHAWDVMAWGDRLIAVGAMSTATESSFAIARLGSAGTLDASFSGDGRQTLSFPGFSDLATEVHALDDGRVVVAGSIDVGNGLSDVALVRYQPDGTIDPAFGDGGVAVLDASGGGDFVRAMALTGGAILVAGQADGCPFLARFTESGELDASFGAAGFARIAGEEGGEITDLAVSPEDGSIHASVSPGFRMLRFDAEGQVDATFGEGGWAFAPGREALGITVQPGRGIVVAGSALEGGVAVARFLLDGTVDPAFGGGLAENGLLILRGGLDRAGDVKRIGGDLVLCATYRDSTGEAFAAIRLSGEGILREEFGTSGITVQDAGDNEVAQAIEVTLGGRIVIAGWAHRGSRDVFALWRLRPVR